MVRNILYSSIFIFRHLNWAYCWEICLIDRNFLKNAKIVVGLWFTAVSAGMAIGGYMAEFETVKGDVTDHEMRIRNLESVGSVKAVTYTGDPQCRSNLKKCGESLNRYAAKVNM